MSTYVIGDVQGCYEVLQRLLTLIKFDPEQDSLWFAGDIINRGPQSLKTIEFIYSLNDRAKMVLGNHDLTCIAAYYDAIKPQKTDTYIEVLESSKVDKYIGWLTSKPLLMKFRNYMLVHAGIPPIWNTQQAMQEALAVQNKLSSKDVRSFCECMFGNKPDVWDPTLAGNNRLRFAINAFTRMRYWNILGNKLEFEFKGKPDDAPKNLIPWFKAPREFKRNEIILFGHWASLMAKVEVKNIIALDTGAVWGNKLTAYKLETKEFFSVNAK